MPKQLTSLYYYLFFVLGLSLYSQFSYASYASEQELIDSLNQYAESHQTSPYASLEMLDEYIDKARQKSWQLGLVKSYLEKLFIYEDMYYSNEISNNIDIVRPIAIELQLHDELKVLQAIELINLTRTKKLLSDNKLADELYNTAATIKNAKYRLNVKKLLGFYYFYQRDLVRSLKISQELQKESKGHGELHMDAYVSGLLSEIYYEAGDGEKSKLHGQRAIEIARQSNRVNDEAVYLYNYVYTLLELGEDEEASTLIPDWEALAAESNNRVMQGDIHRIKGHMALKEGNSEQATALLSRAKTIYAVEGLKDFEMLTNILLVESYLANSRFSKAEALAYEIEPAVNALGYYKHKVDFYRALTAIHKHFERFEDALLSTEKAHLFNTVSLRDKNALEIQKLGYQNELNTKELEKAELTNENKLQEFQLRNQRQKITISVLIAVISLILLAIIIFTLYRQLAAQRKLAVLANTDSLTKAPNRRSILAKAELELVRCLKLQLNYTLVVADIDFFKKINDVHGHDVGDEVLIIFADIAKQTIRKSEYFGRIGGEEWLFVLPGTELYFAETLFERLRENIQQSERLSHKLADPITFSMGAAQLQEKESLKQLIDRADKKLYQAKHNGRDQIHT